MGTGFQIREAIPDDVPAIVDMLRFSLGEGASAELWSWKHVDNPFGVSPCLVAEADDRLVGVRAFMRWNWHYEGREFSAVRAVDTATHPEWRGQRVFSKLTEELARRVEAEGTSFIFNTPNSNSYPGYRKLGWKRVKRVPLWIRLNPIWGAAAPRRQERLGSVISENWVGGEIGSILGDEQVPEFLNVAVHPGNRLCTNRTIHYLRWRYDQNPLHRYFGWTDLDGATGAMLIGRYRKLKTRTAFVLCELLRSPCKAGNRALVRLIRRVRKETKASALVAAASAGSMVTGALLKTGFLPVPKVGPVFTVRDLGDTPSNHPDPTSWSNWSLALGDLEVF